MVTAEQALNSACESAKAGDADIAQAYLNIAHLAVSIANSEEGKRLSSGEKIPYRPHTTSSFIPGCVVGAITASIAFLVLRNVGVV